MYYPARKPLSFKDETYLPSYRPRDSCPHEHPSRPTRRLSCMPKMTPRILIKSDGTIAGTTITTDQGAGNEAELEVTEALTSRLRLGHKERRYVKA